MSHRWGNHATRTIAFVCGHEGEYTVHYSNAAERESLFAWASAKRVCPDCFGAKKLNEHEAAYEAAQRHSDNTFVFPLLAEPAPRVVRSEKQVKFATVVRDAVLTAARNNRVIASDVLLMERHEVTDMNAKALVFTLELFLDVALFEYDPKWWLDLFANSYKEADDTMWDHIQKALLSKGWTQEQRFDAFMAKYPDMVAVNERAVARKEAHETPPMTPTEQKAKRALQRVFSRSVL